MSIGQVQVQVQVQEFGSFSQMLPLQKQPNATKGWRMCNCQQIMFSHSAKRMVGHVLHGDRGWVSGCTMSGYMRFRVWILTAFGRP